MEEKMKNKMITSIAGVALDFYESIKRNDVIKKDHEAIIEFKYEYNSDPEAFSKIYFKYKDDTNQSYDCYIPIMKGDEWYPSFLTDTE